MDIRVMNILKQRNFLKEKLKEVLDNGTTMCYVFKGKLFPENVRFFSNKWKISTLKQLDSESFFPINIFVIKDEVEMLTEEEIQLEQQNSLANNALSSESESLAECKYQKIDPIFDSDAKMEPFNGYTFERKRWFGMRRSKF